VLVVKLLSSGTAYSESVELVLFPTVFTDELTQNQFAPQELGIFEFAKMSIAIGSLYLTL
jgi:hypothetical protein